jgi:hypothetical protein
MPDLPLLCIKTNLSTIVLVTLGQLPTIGIALLLMQQTIRHVAIWLSRRAQNAMESLYLLNGSVSDVSHLLMSVLRPRLNRQQVMRLALALPQARLQQ